MTEKRPLLRTLSPGGVFRKRRYRVMYTERGKDRGRYISRQRSGETKLHTKDCGVGGRGLPLEPCAAPHCIRVIFISSARQRRYIGGYQPITTTTAAATATATATTSTAAATAAATRTLTTTSNGNNGNHSSAWNQQKKVCTCLSTSRAFRSTVILCTPPLHTKTVCSASP